MTVGDTSSNWISYSISMSPAGHTGIMTWQVYVDGRWVPYSTMPIVPADTLITPEACTFAVYRTSVLQVCYKCGKAGLGLYKEGERGFRAPVKVGEPGLCDECYTKFDAWQTTQHGLELLPTCSKSRGEQKLLGTGDLKLG